MDKTTKRRKKQTMVDGVKNVKKRKLAVLEETQEKLVTPSTPAVAANDDSNVSSLRKEIYDWMEKQAEYEREDLDALLEESNHSVEPEEHVDIENIEKPLRVLLRGHTDDEIRKSFKFECEWRKCTFMSGNDRKYFLHVESHAEQVMDSHSGSYACEWDLCGFITEDDYEYMGHVHYHAYHTKLKVHGAGIHMLAKLPSCNLDSRTRNTISNVPVTFRCEWENCNERFNKAMHFFHHVDNHMCDQFPRDKKTTTDDVHCRWSLCEEKFKLRYFALYHLRRHTTERQLACFTCGCSFYMRTKLIDHVARQIEMSQRKHECPICGRFYPTNTTLKAHIELHDKPYECALCPMKFPCKSAVTYHMLRKHLKERNFKCNQCEHASYSKRELLLHMGTHDKTKIFRCEEFGCNVAYRSEYAMKKHFAWHYNLPVTMYGCHICSDKTYKNSYYLSKHLRFVHKIERTPGYSRFLYKADSDGVLRLSSYVEQKVVKQKQSKANETSVSTAKPGKECQEGEKDDRKKQKKVKSPEKAQKQSSVANQEESSHDATAYAPIKGKPKINSIKSIGAHEFLIELGMEPEPAEKEPQPESVGSKDASKEKRNDTAKASKRNSDVVRVKCEEEQVEKPNHPQDESSVEKVETPPQVAQQPKDVKDFMVMKRYLKPSKKSA